MNQIGLRSVDVHSPAGISHSRLRLLFALFAAAAAVVTLFDITTTTTIF